MFAQVAMRGPWGLTLLQTIVIIILLGVLAGVVGKFPWMEDTFKQIVRWICIIGAIVLAVMLLLNAVGLV